MFLRVLAVGQALWFCIDVAARGAQNLAITTLEITTIGIIVDSILIYYIWKDKPADVMSIEEVRISMTLNDMMLLEEDDAARARLSFHSPLDSISRQTWSVNLAYQYLMNIVRDRPRSRSKKNRESLGRRSENDILPVTGAAMVIASLSTVVFMGINFAAWNFHFPTWIERLLWQISSCGLLVILLPTLLSIEFVYNDRGIGKMQEQIQRGRRALEEHGTTREKSTRRERFVLNFRRYAMNLTNNSLENDPGLDVSPLFILLAVPGCAAYSIFRLYILIEDVIAFRALPTNAYSTVDWSAFLPHLA